MVQAVWKVTYRVTARWSKRRNPAIAAGERVTLYVVFPLSPSAFHVFWLPHCDAPLPLCAIWGSCSRVIAPNHPTAAAVAAALEEGQVVVVLARNAIAAAKWATLRVRALRRPEEVQEEATAG